MMKVFWILWSKQKCENSVKFDSSWAYGIELSWTWVESNFKLTIECMTKWSIWNWKKRFQVLVGQIVSFALVRERIGWMLAVFYRDFTVKAVSKKLANFGSLKNSIMRTKFQRFATFNCQGVKDKIKQKLIVDDFYKLRLATIMVQETNRIT